ncbi:hypothetical protein HJ018_24250 [Vibrio parahaemolyticus]|nr:hypothetical protein [Vibrio parahaemolyticus]
MELNFLSNFEFAYLANVGDLLTGLGTLVLSLSALISAFSWKRKNQWERVYSEISSAKEAITRSRLDFYKLNRQVVVPLMVPATVSKRVVPNKDKATAMIDSLSVSLNDLQNALIILESVTLTSQKQLAHSAFELSNVFERFSHNIMRNIDNFDAIDTVIEAENFVKDLEYIRLQLDDFSSTIAEINKEA